MYYNYVNVNSVKTCFVRYMALIKTIIQSNILQSYICKRFLLLFIKANVTLTIKNYDGNYYVFPRILFAGRVSRVFYTRYTSSSVRNGWVSFETRRRKAYLESKNERNHGEMSVRDGERERRKRLNERYETGVKRKVGENEKEENEEELAWVPCALVERIQHCYRFGGKVFGQVQGDAAASAGSLLVALSPSLLPRLSPSFSHHSVSSVSHSFSSRFLAAPTTSFGSDARTGVRGCCCFSFRFIFRLL